MEKWYGKWGLAGGIFTWSSLLSYIEIIIAGLLNLRAWFIKTFWLIDQDCTMYSVICIMENQYGVE